MTLTVRTGRVWKFGDDINTDLVFPTFVFRLPLREQARHVFSANRPGWVDEVRQGDILVAGANFGVGSGRPIGAVLGLLGIEAVVADSINGLGLRNCINFCMPALSCQGVSALFAEGDIASIDCTTGRIENRTTGAWLAAPPLPALFVDIIGAGGVVEKLARDGYIAAG